MKIPTLLDCTIKRPKKFYKRDAKKFIIFVMKSSFQYNFKKRTKTRNKFSFFSCNVVVLIFFIKHLELRKQLNANSIVRKENFANWATLKKKKKTLTLWNSYGCHYVSIINFTWSFGTQLTHFQNDERFPWTSKSPLGIVQIKSEDDMDGDAVVVLHPSANWIKKKRAYG